MHIEDIYCMEDGIERVVVPRAVVYVGRSDNPSFIGSEPLDKLAQRIWQNIGPSGRNKDYLFGIAKIVRELAPDSDDPYLFSLEAKVRELDEIDGINNNAR